MEETEKSGATLNTVTEREKEVEELRRSFCEGVEEKEFGDYRELRRAVNRIMIEFNKERERVYRVYHTSFQEFLQIEVDPGLKTYHRMIANYYLKLAGKEIK